MSTKSLSDISGVEFDWLAVDAEGAVALFSTAGGGYAPDAFLRDTEAHDRAITALLACAASSEALCELQLGPGAENTWLLMAERGVFAFDSDYGGGPYRRIATPRAPIHVSRLPPSIAEVALRIHFEHLRFSALEQVSASQLAQR